MFWTFKLDILSFFTGQLFWPLFKKLGDFFKSSGHPARRKHFVKKCFRVKLLTNTLAYFAVKSMTNLVIIFSLAKYCKIRLGAYRKI
jgi:hypothetical protein